jgi:hypothetical protein
MIAAETGRGLFLQNKKTCLSGQVSTWQQSNSLYIGA